MEVFRNQMVGGRLIKREKRDDTVAIDRYAEAWTRKYREEAHRRDLMFSFICELSHKRGRNSAVELFWRRVLRHEGRCTRLFHRGINLPVGIDR